MRSTAFQATFALLLGAYGCYNPAQPGYPDQVSVQGVKVTPQSVQFVVIGETKQLIATVSPANATDQTLVWESTNSSVASVNETGLVTAKAVGSGVFITAHTHDGNHEASVNVSVNP